LRHQIQGGQRLQNASLVEQRLAPLSPNDRVIFSGHAEQAGCVLQVGEQTLAPDQTQRLFDLRQIEGSRVNLIGKSSDFAKAILFQSRLEFGKILFRLHRASLPS
jgi:hypothetical protein